MDGVWIAIVTALLAPAVMAGLQQWFRSMDKQADYERQDKVAADAKSAADLVAIKTAEVARNLKATNEHIAAAASEQKVQLQEIHALVNSNMTAAMQAELGATTRELVLMIEVIALKKVAGHEPTIESLAASETTKNKIAELTAALSDRLKPARQ